MLYDHFKQVVYYIGKNNINYKTIEGLLKDKYHLVCTHKPTNAELPTTLDAEVVAVIVDIDSTEDWQSRIKNFNLSDIWNPPIIGVTNNREVKEGQLPEVTDLIRLININQINSQLKLLINKLHWYSQQLTLTQQNFQLSQAVLTREQTVMRAIRTALLTDKIYLVYTPMVNLRESQFDSFEVSFKWEDAPLPDITSEEIIKGAETLGVIDLLTKWLLQRVCAFQNSLKAKSGRYFNFNIELSINQIMDPAFFKLLQECLNQYQVPPECFAFQISSEILNKPLFNIETLANRVNQVGVKIMIDCINEQDISLAKISSLPASMLKVDKLNLNNDLTLLSQMAHELGIKLVGENVTAQESQNDFLNQNVDYVKNLYLHQSFENSMNLFDKLATKSIEES